MSIYPRYDPERISLFELIPWKNFCDVNISCLLESRKVNNLNFGISNEKQFQILRNSFFLEEVVVTLHLYRSKSNFRLNNIIFL